MRDDDPQFDLDRLSPSEADLEHIASRRAEIRGRKSAAAKPKYNGAFVRYPLEMIYRISAAKHTSTVKMLPWLLHLQWKAGGKPFKLPNETLARVGVSRREKLRALHELEGFGLIQVARSGRRSPEITVLGSRLE